MKRFRSWQALIALAAGAVLLVFCLIALQPVAGQSAETQRMRVESAIRYAAVQCYALEGAYPPDVEYLKAHYGIRYDETRFFVHYRPNGSNITPDIQVNPSLIE